MDDNFSIETYGDFGIPHFKNPPYITAMNSSYLCRKAWGIYLRLKAHLQRQDRPELCASRTACPWLCRSGGVRFSGVQLEYLCGYLMGEQWDSWWVFWMMIPNDAVIFFYDWCVFFLAMGMNLRILHWPSETLRGTCPVDLWVAS